MDFVEKHMDLEWNWDVFQQNPWLMMDFVERHLNLPWNTHKLWETKIC